MYALGMAHAPSDTADRALFAHVKREPTLSDKVVESITEGIISGRLSPGQRLDSERELADQFGVSRTVIREAVRSLIAQGLVETQSGRGIQVATVGGDAVSRSMRLYLKGNAAIDYRKVHQVRSALEIQIAGLAAEHATEDDFARLAENNEQMRHLKKDVEQAAELDVDFHRATAAATQNELFVVMLDSIGEIMLDVRRRAFRAPGVMQYAIRAHQAILDRLRDRDVDGARAAMREHLETSERAWSGNQRKR